MLNEELHEYLISLGWVEGSLPAPGQPHVREYQSPLWAKARIIVAPDKMRKIRQKITVMMPYITTDSNPARVGISIREVSIPGLRDLHKTYQIRALKTIKKMESKGFPPEELYELLNYFKIHQLKFDELLTLI